jgi:hypothetical protein
LVRNQHRISQDHEPSDPFLDRDSQGALEVVGALDTDHTEL